MIEYIISKLIKKAHLRAIKNSNIDKSAKIGSGSQLVNTTMGKYSYCGYDCMLINVVIGSYCSLASKIEIGGARHPIEWVSTSPVFNDSNAIIKYKYSIHHYDENRITTIGNDVWIGSGVIIKEGVKIGNGSIVAMGSIVTKDIPPYEIWGGNPAKFIRKRFSDEIIAELQNIEWWDFSEEKLKQLAVFVDDIEKFLIKAKEVVN